MDEHFTLLSNGKLDDSNTKSEYERGYIDCWNENYSPKEDKRSDLSAPMVGKYPRLMGNV